MEAARRFRFMEEPDDEKERLSRAAGLVLSMLRAFRFGKDSSFTVDCIHTRVMACAPRGLSRLLLV